MPNESSQPLDDDYPGDLNPIACFFGMLVVDIALAAIWIFRNEIWS